METYHIVFLERLLPDLKESNVNVTQLTTFLVANDALSNGEKDSILNGRPGGNFEALVEIFQTKCFDAFMVFIGALRRFLSNVDLLDSVDEELNKLKERFDKKVEELHRFCGFSFELLDVFLQITDAIDEPTAVKLCQYFNFKSEVTTRVGESIDPGYEFVKYICTTDILMPAGLCRLDMASKELELTNLLKVLEKYERISHLKELHVKEVKEFKGRELETGILRTQSKGFNDNSRHFLRIGKALNKTLRREYFKTTFVKFCPNNDGLVFRVPSYDSLNKLCADITSGKLAEVLLCAFYGDTDYKNYKMHLTYNQLEKDNIQEHIRIVIENQPLCLSIHGIHHLIEQKFQQLMRQEIENGCLYFSQDEATELMKAASDVQSFQLRTNYSLAGGSVMGIAGGSAIILGLLTPISPLVLTAGAIASGIGGIASLTSTVSQSVKKTTAKIEKQPLLEKIRDLVHITEIALKVYVIFFSNTRILRKIVQGYNNACFEYIVQVHCILEDTMKNILQIIESKDKSGIKLFHCLNDGVEILVNDMKDIGLTEEDLLLAKDDLLLSQNAPIKFVKDVYGHLSDAGLVAFLSEKNFLKDTKSKQQIALGKLGTKQAGLMGVKASKKAAGIATSSKAAGKVTSEATESALKTVTTASAKVFQVLGLSLTVAGVAFDSYALVSTVKNLTEGSKTDVSDGFRELGALVTNLVKLRNNYHDRLKTEV